MRLISTCTGEMRDFMSEDELPSYAILSHTWGDEEMKFEEMTDPSFRGKKGYQKILWCCRQAAKDGIHWAWVDT